MVMVHLCNQAQLKIMLLYKNHDNTVYSGYKAETFTAGLFDLATTNITIKQQLYWILFSKPGSMIRIKIKPESVPEIFRMYRGRVQRRYTEGHFW